LLRCKFIPLTSVYFDPCLTLFSLPEVKEKVDWRIRDIDEQLKKYPDPPPNPELEIMKSLTMFTLKVKDRVNGPDFINSWGDRYGQPFKRTIVGLKPKINVREHALSDATRPSGPVVIDLESDSTPSPTMRKRPAPTQEVGQATPKRPRGLQTNGTNGVVKTEPVDHAVFASTPSHLRNATPAGSPSRGSRSKSLMDIRNLVRRSVIPGHRQLVSTSVHEPLFKEAVRTWAPYIDRLINQTFAFLEAEIVDILNQAFWHLANRAVYKQSLEHMRSFVETRKKELRDQIFLLYNLETQRICTTNDDYLESYSAAELKILVRHRNHFRIAAHNGEKLEAVPKMEDLTPEELAQETARMSKELKNLGPDPFESELKVAAYLRGYYLTAAARFTDNVYIHVISGLLPHVASVIDSYLHEKLGLTGPVASKYLDSTLLYYRPPN
jgi:hypothetical protein